MKSPVRTPIVFYGEYTASLSLYLDGLGGDDSFSILSPSNLTLDFERLASAGLVVHVRGFEHAERSGLDSALARLGLPRAWFTDDDLTALHGEQPGFQHYSEARVGGFAGRMIALIATTPALCTRLRAFHANVLHWPCVLDEALVPSTACDRAGPLRVGVIGGDFRRSGLHDVVMPALNGMRGVELVVAEPIGTGIPGALRLPFEPDFRRFIAGWRAAGPAIIAHPPGRSRNLAAKSAGVLLASLYLGAVPVVADEPAFADLGASEGVIRVQTRDVSHWRVAFAELASPDTRARLFARLAGYCRETFRSDRARPALDYLLQHAAPVGAAAEARRQEALRMAWRPRLSYRAASRVSALLSSSRSL